MSFDYIITDKVQDKYKFNITLNENNILHYNDEKYYTEVLYDSEKLICYGYCFDVRNPKSSTENTLSNILMNQSFNEDIGYLNGQFILLYVKNEKELLATIDATSLVPIYTTQNFSSISTLDEEADNNLIYNPNYVVNLIDQSLTRIKVDYDVTEDEEIRYITSLVENQYKYFYNKPLLLNYKSNKYMKALISIMKPVLYENYLTIDNASNKEVDYNFAESIAQDFSMKILDDSDEVQLDNIIYLRNQLLDFNHFFKPNKNYKIEDYIIGDDFSSLSESLQHAEINIISRKRQQSKKLNETGVLYDPFNVHAIYQYLLKNSKKMNNVVNVITQKLLPSISYYDFLKGSTLKQVNSSLSEQLEELQQKQITVSNEQFLLNTKMSFFSVSDNLDGKLKDEEILVYPASQAIAKNEVFSIEYENPGDGLIFIKSFYKNKKNGQSIEIIINNETFTIDEVSNGILINVQSKFRMTMQYKNARNSLPWQKAGTLLIRKN